MLNSQEINFFIIDTSISIYFLFFFFLDPLGLESGRRSAPLEKY